MYKILLLLFVLLIPSTIFAAGYTMLEPLPFLNTTTPNLPELMKAFFNLCMVAGAVLAVLMITFGGVQYMTSDVLGTKDAGRERIKNAAYGLLLLLSIYVILNTINPALLDFRINLKVEGDTTPTSFPASGTAPARPVTPAVAGVTPLTTTANNPDSIRTWAQSTCTPAGGVMEVGQPASSDPASRVIVRCVQAPTTAN